MQLLSESMEYMTHPKRSLSEVNRILSSVSRVSVLERFHSTLPRSFYSFASRTTCVHEKQSLYCIVIDTRDSVHYFWYSADWTE